MNMTSNPFDEDGHAQAILRQIQEEDGNIVLLQRQLNTLTFVSEMPTEVLEEIYFQCLCEHMNRNDPWELVCDDCRRRGESADLPIIVKISHVCHRWRTVILASPRLWTIIHTALGDQCTKEMLARSARLPLFVQMDLPPPRDTHHQHDLLSSEHAVFEHLHRVQDLTIRRWSQDIATSLRNFVGAEAPALRKLMIFKDISYAQGPVEQTTSLEHILSRPCPSLQVLVLNGFHAYSIRPHFLPALRVLVYSVSRVSASTDLGEPEGINTFLSILQGLPLLEKLAIRYILPYSQAHMVLWNPAKSSPGRNVTLPALRSLTLDKFGLHRLKVLRFPVRANVTLVGSFDNRGEAPLLLSTVVSAAAAHFSRLHQTLAGRDDLALRSVFIAPIRFYDVDLVFSSEHIYGPRTPAHDVGIIKFELATLRLNPLPDLFLSEICESVPRTVVRQFSLCCCDSLRFSKNVWWRFMKRFPMLEVLHVEAEGTGRFLFDALYDSSKGTTSQGFVSPFPLLRKLILRPWVQPANDSRVQGNMPINDDSSDYVRVLVVALEERKRHGLTLDELILDVDGDYPEEDFEPLVSMASRGVLRFHPTDGRDSSFQWPDSRSAAAQRT